MSKFKVYVLLFLIYFVSSSLLFTSYAGDTGAQILEIAPYARTIAMGGASCAIADSGGSVFYNPAGLATANYMEILFAENKSIELSYYEFVYSLRDIKLSNIKNPGTVAVSWNALNQGTVIDRDEDGWPTFYLEAHDQVLTFTYGKTLIESKSAGSFMTGLCAKFYKDHILDNRAKGEAFDAGILWKYPMRRFFIGAACKNIGEKADYGNKKLYLPLKTTIGISGEMMRQKLVIGLDFTKPEHDNLICKIGAEFWTMSKTLSFRLGYDSHSQVSCDTGLTAGCGLSLKKIDFFFFYIREINVDYAYKPHDKPGDPHWFSIKFKLGAD